MLAQSGAPHGSQSLRQIIGRRQKTSSFVLKCQTPMLKLGLRRVRPGRLRPGRAGKVTGAPCSPRGSARGRALVAEPDALRPTGLQLRGPQEHPVVVSDHPPSPEQSPRPHSRGSRNKPPEAGSPSASTPQGGRSLPVRSRRANPAGSWFTTQGARRLRGR